jgi:predicted transcriptional regulator
MDPTTHDTATPTAALDVEEGPEVTDRERRVLEFIIAFTAKHFYQPSVREIGDELGIPSTKTVSEVLQSLAAKGYIADEPPGGRRGARSVAIVGIEVTLTRKLRPPRKALPQRRRAG